jgi:16S rRNA (guanine527-N7)-methyltransferase
VSETAAELYGDGYGSVCRYVDILADRGVVWGLIGPREVPRLWERHVLNSAALSELIPFGATVADVGSGAGLPGIPLAILRPDLSLTLIEPLLRRFNFLTQAVDELGITPQVDVVRVRAEDHSARYDVVASRALAPLSKLVTWCAPLREHKGAILALKGRSAGQEVESATQELAMARLQAAVLLARAHPLSAPTTVVRLTSATTPSTN